MFDDQHLLVESSQLKCVGLQQSKDFTLKICTQTKAFKTKIYLFLIVINVTKTDTEVYKLCL